MASQTHTAYQYIPVGQCLNHCVNVARVAVIVQTRQTLHTATGTVSIIMHLLKQKVTFCHIKAVVVVALFRH